MNDKIFLRFNSKTGSKLRSWQMTKMSKNRHKKPIQKLF